MHLLFIVYSEFYTALTLIVSVCYIKLYDDFDALLKS